VDDIRIAYSGNKAATKLEGALHGPMSGMLPADEKAKLIDWIHSGVSEAKYNEAVKPIIDSRCKACHDGSNPHLPNLTSYDGIKKVADVDTGVSIGTLVRVSHIHLFGTDFYLLHHGHDIQPRLLPETVGEMCRDGDAFRGDFLDIASWWLTKVSEPFAYVVIVGGALMGVSFAIQWGVSMFQIWFFKGRPNEAMEAK